jgi:hypothetical protein
MNPRLSYVLQVNVKACNKALLGCLASEALAAAPAIGLTLSATSSNLLSDAGIRGHLILPRT